MPHCGFTVCGATGPPAPRSCSTAAGFKAEAAAPNNAVRGADGVSMRDLRTSRLRGGVQTTHLLVGMIVTFVALILLVGSVALGSVSKLNEATADGERWRRIDSLLLSLSDDIGGVVADTHGAARRQIALDVEDDLLRFKVEEAMSLLRTDLSVVAADEPADMDLALVKLEESAEEIITRAVLAIEAHQNDDEPELNRQLRRLLNAHQGFRLRLQVLHRMTDEIESTNLIRSTTQSDDRLRQVELAAMPTAALVIGMLFAARRIRRRERRLLTELRHAQQRSQAIVDCLPVEIAWKNLDHEFLGVNRLQGDTMAAWGVEDPIGKTLAAVAPEEGRATWLAVETMEQQAIIDSEVKVDGYLVRTIGGDRTLRYSCAPLVEDNRTIGVVTFSEDVTEAREMERALATSGRMESIGQLAAGVASPRSCGP